ncbi:MULTISPECIES: thiopurine S-methyltransferase [unclassified Pseudomonas]|uniref:thiopurine S-methyltransferase n=1 Tax=unclassified Pseudomonas TaxID=196821 RepID=UPI0021C616A8|nr:MULTISPECIES: thiopurine S-methyltransferase [unclassified Pseudomonas]MCU1733911.1 thiopurine S-methyltransferase [Pseudomonas sp. 20P_3.2_Bac4]MCU1747359.1 thiopurine S-methyltransferase [Pseudomonas sp. 20P_3.2_Bac5]
MHADFWHKRWERNQIGFHQEQVNSYLAQYWPSLGINAGGRVLVPLCGKSLDLAWLAGQGLRVLGVELSQRAVEGFFAEQQLEPERFEHGAFTCYRSEGIELWCGDFFQLSAADVADCVGLYDRAALIALPSEMRERYAAHLNVILPTGCGAVLVTMDYDQSQLDGPPFAVTDDEVRRLFTPRWQILAEDEQDILGQSWKFLQAGVSRLLERVYVLRG